jgi:hypothetical protein
VATTFEEVTTYKVFFYGGPNGNGGRGASIFLGIPDAFAWLDFYLEESNLPQNYKTTNIYGKTIYGVSHAYGQLDQAIDLLRNESPMWFFFNDVSLNSYLTTSSEPVGEEETP